MGQEIVERIRSRGQVRRKFTGFDVHGALPVSGSKIQVEGKEVGEIPVPLPFPERAAIVVWRWATSAVKWRLPASVLDAGGSEAGRCRTCHFYKHQVRKEIEGNMAEKKQESFTVTDRRLFTSEGELRKEVSEEEIATSKPAAAAPAAPPPQPASARVFDCTLDHAPSPRLRPRLSKRNKPTLTANRPRNWTPGSSSAATPPKKWR